MVKSGAIPISGEGEPLFYTFQAGYASGIQGNIRKAKKAQTG
jgi:hypothetical protein